MRNLRYKGLAVAVLAAVYLIVLAGAASAGEVVDTAGDCVPDGDEVCDGVDNNCDGEVDEYVLGQEEANERASFYPDSDGDGYGDPNVVAELCGSPEGFVPAGGDADCDDNDDTVYPDAEETCGDRVDSDCDGSDGTEAIGLCDVTYTLTGGDGCGRETMGHMAIVSPFLLLAGALRRRRRI
jgi:hypothetical protein